MLAIFKRDLRSYFCTFIGWLFMAAVLFLVGLYVTAYNLAEGSPYISYALQSSLILFIIGISILTMRVLAEERKNKTDQLILTAPVSVWEIVLGKYLAASVVFVIPCIVLCFYPLLMGRYGALPYGETYASICGFFLYGMAAIAIGVFLSSLTENPVIAAVFSVILLFIGYIMSGFCNLISQGGSFLTGILSAFDMLSPFADLANGNIRLTSVFYYISVIVLMLFFTTQSIQKRRYSVSARQLGRGAYSIGSIVLVTAIVIVFNLLLRRIPEKYISYDVTQEKLYSISDESYKMIDFLQDDIVIYVLATEEQMSKDVLETLHCYADYSSHIKIEYVNLSSRPDFAKQYTEEQVTPRSLIVASDKRAKYIDYDALFLKQLSYETYDYETVGYDAEGQITGAIAYVTSDETPKVYFLEGHGEQALEDSYLSALDKLNTAYENLSLLTTDAVPEDTACLLVNAPKTDLSKDDVMKIQNYLDKGGNAMFLYGYSEDAFPNYRSLIEDYGITIGEGMVVEQDKKHYYENMLYLLPETVYDEVTEKASENYVFAPYSCGIVMDEKAEEEGRVHYLLKSTEASFLRKDPAENTGSEKTEQDIGGPFAIGVRVSRKTGSGEGRVIVYTSAILFTEMANEVTSGNNLTLFTDSVSCFLPEDNGVMIPAKYYNQSLLMVPTADFIILSVIMIAFIPLALVVNGLVIWLQRRKL